MLNLTILANDIIYVRVYEVHIFQNTHIAAYDKIHMHMPPKRFHPIVVRNHTNGKGKTRGNVYQEIGIQNINEGKIPKSEGIHIIRIIGNTNIGGGT